MTETKIYFGELSYDLQGGRHGSLSPGRSNFAEIEIHTPGEEQTPRKLNWQLDSYSKVRKNINFKDLWTQANLQNISESSVILLKCILTHCVR